MAVRAQMTWLVTGGAGYIGAHVVRAFLAEGMKVVVIDDLSSGHAEFVPDGVPFVRGTILDAELLRRTFAEHDIRGVVHVAGYKYAGVYGTPRTDLVTEDTAKNPESPYGESKLIGEWLLRDQGVAAGLRHTSLRYFNVVGSGATDLRDTSPHNLFPLVFEAPRGGRTPRIHGDAYAPPAAPCR